MKSTIEQIEIFSDLLKQGFEIKDCLELLTSLYHQNFNSFKSYLEEGKGSVMMVSQMYEDHLYQELILFYSQYMDLSSSIDQSLLLIKKLKEFKQRMIHILLYPALLLIAVTCFSFFALFYLRPQFFTFYDSFNIQLSSFHLWLLNAIFYLPVLFIVVIGLSVLILLKTIEYLKKGDILKLHYLVKYPLIKQIIQIYLSMKFNLYYKEFINEEIDLNHILLFLKTKCNDLLIRQIAYNIDDQLMKGQAIEAVIEKEELFENYYKLIYRISLSLHDKGKLFESYFNMTIERIAKAIETFKNIITPLIYAFVGIYIIGIYALMIIPMTNMISEL